jgi:hypothetical protein
MTGVSAPLISPTVERLEEVPPLVRGPIGFARLATIGMSID